MNSTVESAIRSNLQLLVANRADIRADIRSHEASLTRLRQLEVETAGKIDDLTEALPESVSA